MSQRIQNSEYRVKTFENLVTWQRARELTLLIYKLTDAFPASEKYNLVPQMRRSVVSVTSNIAEGFGRQQPKDKDHYYVMALGSLSELSSQVIVSGDLLYIDQASLRGVNNKLVQVRKLLTALLAKHRQ